MKFVALLSGGKDSCYNIVHCHANGHELVAAASLKPPTEGEMDSFMYQTVGQDAIELVARALEVPLFRRTINGSAVEQGGEYGDRAGKADRENEGVDGDETEDMFTLLSEVKVSKVARKNHSNNSIVFRMHTQMSKVYLLAQYYQIISA
ncbi:hypothetical protein BN14_00391 [Rhizoctonia solani AG-1 IB]|uniref:Diphthine--ammonia ligase n=1 Tax=Thanatephorus cucumeris (strain AG1-IB / isolate 7/3/14) TaxID=1108050 RepID=M5BHV8_THACB|nr:hypothetical protein BN14_00391 [Rhizoctonia solani AG-1 IB]